jgi:hypothetical protein
MQGSATTAMREHRREALTPQVTPRRFRLRRSPRRPAAENFSKIRQISALRLNSLGRRSRSERLRPKVEHDVRIHFSAAW